MASCTTLPSVKFVAVLKSIGISGIIYLINRMFIWFLGTCSQLHIASLSMLFFFLAFIMVNMLFVPRGLPLIIQ